MHTKNILSGGKPLNEAKKVLLMLHGRGATAHDILEVASLLKVKDFALLAPQATYHTWYPKSFLAKQESNQPWLDSAINLLNEIVDDVTGQGIPTENIYLLGFSQGACLTLEFAARNAMRYGGIVAFTGGLIGDVIRRENYYGDFQDTPFFLSSGNPDLHVPLQRVEESVCVLEKMNALVRVKIYENRPHCISKNEIDLVNKFIF